MVVRARSICLFVEPTLVSPDRDLPVTLPYACASFGWVDGVSLATPPRDTAHGSQPSLSMLVRTKGDDPWSLQDQFKLLTLNSDTSDIALLTPHDDASSTDPHSRAFPLSLVTSLSSPHRGPLRCSDMVLGSYGTAVWVQPADWSVGGLISSDVHLQHVPVPTSQETLFAAIFPGPLSHDTTEARIKVSLPNSGSTWSCLDYDEERGLIAVGSSSGSITLFSL